MLTAVVVMAAVMLGASGVGAQGGSSSTSSTSSSTTTTTRPTTTTTRPTTTTTRPTTTQPPTTLPPTTLPPTTLPPTTASSTTTSSTTTSSTTTTVPPPTVAPTTAAPTTATTEAPTTTTTAPVPTENSSEAGLRWVVAGLVSVAGAITALTVLYWRHTRPLIPVGAVAPDTGEVNALVGLSAAGAAVPVLAKSPAGSDATLVGPTGGDELPTVESVFGPDASPLRPGAARAGAVLAEPDYEYVEVDPDEVHEGDGYEYLEVEVELPDEPSPGKSTDR